MVRIIARYLFVAALALGVLAPMVSAALAGLGLADGRVMVICTGDGLRTLRLDDAGTPVETSHTTDPCALIGAMDTAVAITPAAPHLRLLWAREVTRPKPPLRGLMPLPFALARGPPMA